MPPSERLIDDLADAILDGSPIDWAAAESSPDGTASLLVTQLRVLAAVADLHRSTPPRPSIAPVMWSHLRLIERVGSGAFGEVYRAWDTRLDREVALKLLPAEGSSGDRAASTIIHEGRLLARVRHPNVVTIHGAEQIADQIGLWMEFVRGHTLEQILEQRTVVSAAEAVHIGLELCRAMSAVHGAGLLHRDIKTHNVMRAEDGRIVLMDFGTSRDLDDDLASDLAGTPLYLAPEVLEGQQATVQSDIYSLGVLLFHLVAGSYPVHARTVRGVRRAHQRGERTAVRTARRDVPPKLASVIERAIAPRPEQRYETADALGADLSALKPRPRIVRLAYAAGIAAACILVAAAGWELVGRQVGSSRTPSAAKRLAILPFENLGSQEDDYFADGITDEVRGKLTKLPGLEIVARTSSNGYRKTQKKPQEIGKELNAEYLLTGTVRFAKESDGTRRVQVSPELSLASSGASRWAQPFEATLTDVFQVQGEIATRVAQALDVALSVGEKRSLAATSTRNLLAYEAYLRGEEASQAMAAADPPSLRRAIGYYEQAVALDPRFVEAWASLSRASSFVYGNSAPTAAAAERARETAEKALALAPERAEGHQALGDYYRVVLKDAARALPEMYRARRLSPGSADYATSLALTRQYLGQWEASLGDLEEAQRLDPRSVNTLRRLGFVNLRLHRTSESRKAYDRGLELAPTNLSLLREKALTYLAEGDLAGARAVLTAAAKEVDSTGLLAFVSQSDLVWVFDEAQRELLVRLTPSAFDQNRAAWALCLARAFALKRDEPNVRKYAEIARADFERQLEVGPKDALNHAGVGLSLAYLGRKAAAIREAERAVELLPISRDAQIGPYIQHQLVRVYILSGENEKALDTLEPLLKIPYHVTPGWLAIDPNFDPVRQSARFKRLTG